MAARLYLPPPLLPMSHLYPARRQDRLSDEFLERNKQNRANHIWIPRPRLETMQAGSVDPLYVPSAAN